MENPRDDLEILLIEDNPGDARLIQTHLQSRDGNAFAPPTLTHAETLDAGLAELREASYDLLVLDLGLPESTGLATLDRYMAQTDEDRTIDPLPVVVLTGLNDDETALKAIERGAQDYLVKDNMDGNVLHRTIRHALERVRQERELTVMKQVLTRVLRHNIRNDLTAIRGRCAEIAEQSTGPLEEHAEVMLELCDGLVDVTERARTVESIVESEGGPQRLALTDAVERSLARARAEHPNATITVEERAAPDVWAHPDLAVGLTSVIGSALPDGREAARTATVLVEAGEDTASVAVRGPDAAVPQADIDAVRAEEETALEHASGVGLWLAYLVVNRSDGDIRFDRADSAATVVLRQAD
jgi:CheY-like chemotaxis protein